tara:strand:+ start:888 stop:1157 length:270 start_codon:yes stop_codon:yes gene_type:complete
MRYDFSLVLKAVRDKFLLTQGELSAIVHISVGAITELERAKRKPSIASRKKINYFLVDNDYSLEMLVEDYKSIFEKDSNEQNNTHGSKS